jgi:hypothetical protein
MPGAAIAVKLKGMRLEIGLDWIGLRDVQQENGKQMRKHSLKSFARKYHLQEHRTDIKIDH